MIWLATVLFSHSVLAALSSQILFNPGLIHFDLFTHVHLALVNSYIFTFYPGEFNNISNIFSVRNVEGCNLQGYKGFYL